jgi:hypothetical protein
MTNRTFDAITVRDITYKVDNRTDYYLDKWLYSDYGFKLWYRTQRGMEEIYWNEILNDYNFQLPAWKLKKAISHQTLTYDRSLDLHDFLTRSFYIEWSSGLRSNGNGYRYGLYFDYRNSSIIVDDNKAYWDIL